jgi:hypothetical protein
MKINTDIIKALNPCKDRYDNWVKHYPKFNKDTLDFLELKNITASDKIWVSVRVLPKELVDVFAIDCAFRAYVAAATCAAATCVADYAADAAAAYAASSAAYAADAAAYAAAAAADYAAADAADAAAAAEMYFAADYTAADNVERENQVDALIILINEFRKDQNE